MAKKRKTRKQKLLSDLHRKASYKLNGTSYEVSLPTFSEKISTAPKHRTNYLVKYPFLVEDITRTAMVTGAIFAAQLILLFLLKFHFIKLPGISY